MFVTGGIGPGVTSSLFQTVFDQDFTLQTANPVLDMTFGFSSSSVTLQGLGFTIDVNGKYLFPSHSLMMREKMDMYSLHAQSLLGNATERFSLSSGSTASPINEALFIDFKRLFHRDQIKRETFAIKLNPTASAGRNLEFIGTPATRIYSDIGSSQNKEYLFGGQVSTIVDSANTAYPIGLMFIDKGICVLDMARAFDQTVLISGSIRGMSVSGFTPVNASFLRFAASGSIDEVVDHICSTRFSGSAATAITFQNVTNINSTIFFSRLAADEFNYSSNPSYTDADSRIVVIDVGQEETQRSFTFITSIGLYDANDNLLAVGKTSRPILKQDDRDLTLKSRIDF